MAHIKMTSAFQQMADLEAQRQEEISKVQGVGRIEKDQINKKYQQLKQEVLANQNKR